MSSTKNVPGNCQHCGGGLEFAAERLGQTAVCPHCGQTTELTLATPAQEESALPRKAIVFVVVSILILAGGMFAAQIAIRRAKTLRGGNKPAPVTQPATTPATSGPFATRGFQVGDVKLEKQSGGSIVYAVGAISETANRKRFGVRVELDLLDSDGKKIGVAKDYQSVLDAGATWNFRALVMERKTVRATVAQITEDQ